MINDAINIPHEVITCLVALIIHPHNILYSRTVNTLSTLFTDFQEIALQVLQSL